MPSSGGWRADVSAPHPDPLDPDRDAALNAWLSVLQAVLPLLQAAVFFYLGWRCAEFWGAAG